MSRVSGRGNSPHYVWGEQCDGWHLLRSPELSVIEERMPPGTKEVQHYHRQAQQLFYVISGAATFDIEGHRLIVEARQSVHIPAGAIHSILNESSSDLEFIVISCPHSHGDRVVIPETSPERETIS